MNDTGTHLTRPRSRPWIRPYVQTWVDAPTGWGEAYVVPRRDFEGPIGPLSRCQVRRESENRQGAFRAGRVGDGQEFEDFALSSTLDSDVPFPDSSRQRSFGHAPVMVIFVTCHDDRATDKLPGTSSLSSAFQRCHSPRSSATRRRS